MSFVRPQRILRAGLILAILCPTLRSSVGQFPADTRRTTDVTFVVPDREIRQHLTRAQEAITEENYSDAVEELGGILTATRTEDYFLPAVGSETVRSIKSEAIRLLDKLPAKGRERYELLFGAEAKAALDRAIRTASVAQLSDIVARYFHAAAGQDAGMLLARVHLDHGRSLAAAVLLARVATVSGEKYDPELSVLQAIAWQQAGKDERAEAALLALKQRQPQVKIRLRRGDVKLFEQDDQALTWLQALTGDSAGPDFAAADEWPLFRGTPTRTGLSAASDPLPTLRTQFETSDSSAVGRENLRTIQRKSQETGMPLLPAIQPIVVGDLVITRNFERLVASRFDNGLRIWAFPFGNSPDQAFDPNPSGVQSPRTEVNVRQLALQQRLFEDAAFGQMSSDGEQVFVLADLGAALPAANYRPNFRQPLMPENTSPTYNRLVSLDIRSQGKLRWQVGDTKGHMEPKLAGAFFLGAPLPFQRQLYVLAEVKGEIRLVVLNAQTGQLEWSQQLAQTEVRSIAFDPNRRLAAASPALADGVLICPTSAGVVVAIDLNQRSLLWGYVYPRADLARYNDGNPFGSRNRPAPPVGTRWVDSSPTIAGGYVLLTPPESDELHCVDLLTGRPAWLPQKRTDLLENMLYLACVKDHTVMLVGKDKVVAVGLASGKPAWSAPIALPAWPSGRGVFDGQYYYLPLASSELLKIDVAKGQIVGKTVTQEPLGNLVVYRGDLISQSAERCAIFHLREPLAAEIATRLKANPRDVWALTRQGEMLYAAGKTDEALDSLRAAYATKPDDADARGALVRTLLTALKTPGAGTSALVDEVEQLIDQPTQRAEFLRLQAEAARAEKRYRDAFLAYLKLAQTLPPRSSEATAGARREEPEKGLFVRSDRWLQSRLLSAYRQANDGERTALDTEIARRLADASQQPSFSPGGLLSLLAFHPAAGPAALEFARKNQSGDRPLATQTALLPLLASSDQKVAGQAAYELGRLYQSQSRPDQARTMAAALESRFGKVEIETGKTGLQLRDQLLSASPGKLQPNVWPTGKVEATHDDRQPRTPMPTYERRYPVPLSIAPGSTEGWQVFFDQGQNRLMVLDASGRFVVSVTVSKDTSARLLSPNMLHATVRGNLLVALIGADLLAVDLFRTGYDSPDAILWRQEVGDRNMNPLGGYSYQQRSFRNPISGPRQILLDANGRPLMTPAAVGPWGVCFARGKQLLCLDALTGETLWERLLATPPEEVFGDEQYLFVVSARESAALVLDPWDGSHLGTREVRPLEQRWITRGRNLLHWTEQSGKVRLELTDVWNKTALWSREVPIGGSSTRGTLIQGEELALYEPDGMFRVISLDTGRELLSQKLASNETLLGISVQRSSSQYLLMANEPPSEIDTQFSHRAPSPEFSQHPFVSGRLYALDRASGKPQWQTPAYIAQFCLPMEQPVESPALVFLRLSKPLHSDFRSKPVTGVVAIDKQTGRLLYQTQDFSPEAQNFDIWSDPDKKQVFITLMAGDNRTTVLRYTDAPTPPEPSAQLGPHSSLSRGEPAGKPVDVSEGFFQLERPRPPR